MRRLVLLVLVLAGLTAPAHADSPTITPDDIGPGHVIVMRHALAPGTGDPPDLTLGDCGTQRNLDDRGRAQARALGEALRDAGLTGLSVLSSQWCRCLETARLLDVGEVRPFPPLNSFFRWREREADQMAALRDHLASMPADAPPTVMVTHQVVISSLTGVFARSGEAVVVRAGTRPVAVVGRLALER
ncbi:histidine phosphatase family protein [Roseospira navarrensis]|uniref:Histidine phosphatase family protein n=1 Tax=Roseospira navarrensis TaxID=140058 RepID=A0A7X1ZG20_9PROT|nr:histidine phosphatase family protein [Roseospira navarrensis]MQX37707.1 histidine phosphatase family protein [Roseospira navarrensis]